MISVFLEIILDDVPLRLLQQKFGLEASEGDPDADKDTYRVESGCVTERTAAERASHMNSSPNRRQRWHSSLA